MDRFSERSIFPATHQIESSGWIGDPEREHIALFLHFHQCSGKEHLATVCTKRGHYPRDALLVFARHRQGRLAEFTGKEPDCSFHDILNLYPGGTSRYSQYLEEMRILLRSMMIFPGIIKKIGVLIFS
jgi:hypothetical protein